jgi:hypothetical protein
VSSLKDSVDEEDASDTIDLFNEMLKFYKQDVQNLRDTTFLQCLTVLEKSRQDWKVDDLVQAVCSKNSYIDLYIGKRKKSQYNYKIKNLKSLFNKHPNVRRVNDKLTTYVWVNKDDRIEPVRQIQTDNADNERTYKNDLEQSPDVSDASASQNGKARIKNTRYSDSADVKRTVLSTTSPTT